MSPGSGKVEKIRNIISVCSPVAFVKYLVSVWSQQGAAVDGQRNLLSSPLQGTQALEAVEGSLMTGSITRELGGTNLNPPIQPVAGCSSTEADVRRNVNIILWTILADGFLFISRSDYSWKISVDTYQFYDICTWPEMK